MFTANLKYEKTITMVTIECCNCGVVFGMPSDLNEVFRNDPSKYFYCPSGHPQHYSQSKEERLRKEAEALLRKQVERADSLYMNLVQVEGQLKKEQRKTKRLTNGLCPCCNRLFHNLQQHMKKQHPEEVSKKR
jgi:hypothetical protein